MRNSKATINVLIVDDEEEVRDLLTIMLRAHDRAEVIGTAAAVDEAVRLTESKRPDLVLLDIQMPEKDGFEYLEEIRRLQVLPGIIFVTAFENYAIKAIRSAAFDYLLKPVNKLELYHAIDRYLETLDRNRSSEISELIDMLSKSKPGRLRLNTRTGYFFVDPEDIIYCEADGNYSHIWLANGKREITTLNLGNLEKSLDENAFLRVSRSFIINMHYLSRVDRKMNLCELSVGEHAYQIKIPSQNLRILEGYFG